ncbi:MAG TPA: hypothetical protein VLQ89_08080, partial [Candidatus Binatia bacterium]|nr:hypothetical protein [Candidatus Binatia bacterium]
MRRYEFPVFIFAWLLGLSMMVSGDSPRPELKADPGLYRGSCPATITFRAEILPPPLPGHVRYKFVRSDGATAPVEVVRFHRLRKKVVSTTWTIGHDYSGWVKLVILFPAHVESNKAHFRIECQSSTLAQPGPGAGTGAGTGRSADERLGAEAAASRRFFVDFRDAYLVFEPASNNLQIVAANSALCYGQKWDKVQLKPYLYHLRRNDWTNFFWQVNTSRKEVLMIRNGDFGRITAGERQELAIEVEPVGRGGEARPERFLLRFPNAYLAYVPADEMVQIVAAGAVLSRGEDWT